MIKINEEYFINADSQNYILQKKTKVKDPESKNFGQEIYLNLGYYSTLDSCINGIIKNETRNFISKNNIKSLEDLQKYIKKLEKDIVIKEKI